MSQSRIEEKGVIIVQDERKHTAIPAAGMQASNPSQLIALAIQKDFDVDRLRELMTLEREWRADQAKAAYAEAMAEFGVIKQTIGHNRSGVAAGGAKFSYSDFPTLASAVTPWLAKCGLSFSHRKDVPVVGENGKVISVMVYCKVMHKAGHFEEASFFAMPDMRLDGKLSPSQLIQLAITYGKRQTLCELLGIATSEDVDDSDSQAVEVSRPQIKQKLTDARLTNAIASIKAGTFSLAQMDGFDLTIEQKARLAKELEPQA